MLMQRCHPEQREGSLHFAPLSILISFPQMSVADEVRTNLHTICKILPTATDLTTFTLTSVRMPFRIGSPFVAPLRLVILEAEKYLAGISLCRDSRRTMPPSHVHLVAEGCSN
jgi:hypothetical protein